MTVNETGIDGVTPANVNTDPVNRPSARDWARVNGWPDVKDTGRLPDAVRDAYAKAYPAA